MRTLDVRERSFWQTIVLELLPVMVGNELDEIHLGLVRRYVDARLRSLDMDNNNDASTKQRQVAHTAMMDAWRDAMGCDVSTQTNVNARVAAVFLIADRAAIELGFRSQRRGAV